MVTAASKNFYAACKNGSKITRLASYVEYAVVL